jgi:hypothetical protein
LKQTQPCAQINHKNKTLIPTNVFSSTLQKLFDLPLGAAVFAEATRSGALSAVPARACIRLEKIG